MLFIFCNSLALDKAKRQHQEGLRVDVVQKQLNDLEREATGLLKGLAALHASMLLQYSTYKQNHQDMLFFETFYKSLLAVLTDIFAAQKRREDIENQIGYIFRTPCFNTYQRKNDPPRSIDTLSLRELYSVKRETSNRALNGQLLSSLFVKAPTIPCSKLFSKQHSITSPIFEDSRNKGACKLANNLSSLSTYASLYFVQVQVEDSRMAVLAARLAAEGQHIIKAVKKQPTQTAPSNLPVHIDAAGMVHDENVDILQGFRRDLNRIGRPNGNQEGAT